MPFTISGRNVRPGGLVHPSLMDIAVGLSRQPRFAGQGRRWFSVLDHSLFADELVKRTPENPIIAGDEEEARRHWRLAVLLHDAHEAITGDVPTPLKSAELKLKQLELDKAISETFYPGGWRHFLSDIVVDAVKHIDRRALVAEAAVIGPPVSDEKRLLAFGATDQMQADMTLLENLLTSAEPKIGYAPAVFFQEEHPGVQEYLKRVIGLM